jgi:hypothetical protein
MDFHQGDRKIESYDDEKQNLESSCKKAALSQQRYERFQ